MNAKDALARKRLDGSYDVSFTIKARKLDADGEGKPDARRAEVGCSPQVCAGGIARSIRSRGSTRSGAPGIGAARAPTRRAPHVS